MKSLDMLYLWLYGIIYMVKTTKIAIENLLPLLHGPFSISSKDLYTPSHSQDSTYHNLCYTIHGAQAGTRNSSMGPS